MAALLALAAPAAWAQTTSPLGAYQGETINFGHDPTVGLAPTPCHIDASGPTLVFSNDPEKVPAPGILYRATVSGAARILVFHVNGSRQPLHIGVLMTNPENAPVNVVVQHIGVAGPGTDPLEVGKQAEHLWFQPHAFYTYALLGHHSWFLDGALADTPVPPGKSLAAVYDVTTTAPVVFTVVAQTKPSLSLAGLRVLPSTSLAGGYGTPMRGTFPDANLTCSVTAAVPTAGLTEIRLGTAGTFIQGVSSVDGNAPAVDDGNYGVLYHLHLTLTSSLSSPYSSYAVLLHAHNNVFAGVASVSGSGGMFPAIVPLPIDQPQVRRASQAVMLGMVRLLPLVPTTLDLQWMPAAGSTLPVDLLVYGVY